MKMKTIILSRRKMSNLLQKYLTLYSKELFFIFERVKLHFIKIFFTMNTIVRIKITVVAILLNKQSSVVKLEIKMGYEEV